MRPSQASLLAAAAVLACPQIGAAADGAPATVDYWMSAETQSGMMAGASGGRAAAMASLLGAGPTGDAATHHLILQIGSPQRPADAPRAEHLPPSGLRAGASLPLLTPRPDRGAAPTDHHGPGPMDQPRGRMLIYWGCGEHARAGQPTVIDFAKLKAGAPLNLGLQVQPMRPPAPDRDATYGEWPNEKTRATVPPGGSLLGAHLVKGNYTPDIRFDLAPGQDFLPPFALTGNATTATGAARLNWRPLAGARATFASVIGGGEDGTVVVWSSSEVPIAGSMIADYLAPAEVARLLQQKALMAPETTECLVPREVVKAAPSAMVNMIAFGQEANFSWPARPSNAPKTWRPDWTVKVRYRSTTSAILGMTMPSIGAQAESIPETPTAPAQKKGDLGRSLGSALLGAALGLPLPN